MKRLNAPAVPHQRQRGWRALLSLLHSHFYLGFLEGLLRMFPSWTWEVAGHEVAWNVFIPALVVPGLFFGAAAAWPFLEQWITGDRREHHVNDRSRNTATRTAVAAAAVTFWGILWTEGANDVIAVQLSVPLYLTTEIARWAIFIGPVAAYLVTRRICLGLQRQDLLLLEHGLETGVIRQLPTGAYVEETRPLSEEERAVLQSRTASAALPAGPPGPGRPVPAGAIRGGLARARGQLNQVLTESIPAPTDGRNGHGPDSSGQPGDSRDPDDAGQAHSR